MLSDGTIKTTSWVSCSGGLYQPNGALLGVLGTDISGEFMSKMVLKATEIVTDGVTKYGKASSNTLRFAC